MAIIVSVGVAVIIKSGAGRDGRRQARCRPRWRCHGRPSGMAAAVEGVLFWLGPLLPPLSRGKNPASVPSGPSPAGGGRRAGAARAAPEGVAGGGRGERGPVGPISTRCPQARRGGLWRGLRGLCLAAVVRRVGITPLLLHFTQGAVPQSVFFGSRPRKEQRACKARDVWSGEGKTCVFQDRRPVSSKTEGLCLWLLRLPLARPG